MIELSNYVLLQLCHFNPYDTLNISIKIVCANEVSHRRAQYLKSACSFAIIIEQLGLTMAYYQRCL